MSVHREPRVPSVIFLQESNGFVLVNNPQKWRFLTDFGTQMSAHRGPCVPSVVFLQENNGLVLVKGPSVDFCTRNGPPGRPESQLDLG